MPGRLTMEQHAASRPEALKKERKQEHGTPVPTQIRKDHQPKLDGLPNGVQNDAQKNGVLTMNGSPITDGSDRLPPELEHYSDTYRPMGVLFERMAQQCHFDLLETINAMAEIGIPQTGPTANGISGQANAHPDSSDESLARKKRLMDFAFSQKDRFIKALVLTDWARNMKDIDKLIDLTVWLRKQDFAALGAVWGLSDMKRALVQAKMPNPNIEGALELLSTGRAPWMPDLGYIPPKPLTAQKLLKTLKDMNFTLTVRLNLHEELPRYFHDYSIASGRVTFVVPGEFEVDLSVADEDPESPFYFIDIRLLFSPAPPLPDGPLRAGLEGKVNEILAAGGLDACYNFLHGFVLTHKINVLKRQAYEMARSKWSECIRIEPVHRSLVVQYWTGQPGGPNWIELGIASGTHKRKRKTSEIQCRWFRRGKEVSDPGLVFEFTNLSMESILEQVIARHISGRLTVFRDQTLYLSRGSSAFSTDLRTSEVDPGQCSLSTRLSSAKPVVLRIEKVTGNIALSPPTPDSHKSETVWNQDPSRDAGPLLSDLHCKTLMREIREQAHRIGWIQHKTSDQKNIQALFKGDVGCRILFIKRGWGAKWTIAVTINLHGEKWWAAELGDGPGGQIIQNVYPLEIKGESISPISRDSLLRVEQVAVGIISLASLDRELRQLRVPHTFHRSTNEPTGAGPASTDILSLYINFPLLMHNGRPNSWKEWASGYLLLTHHGLSNPDPSQDQVARVRHIVKGTLSPAKAADLAQSIPEGNRIGDDVAFKNLGQFAILLRTTFGEAMIPKLKARLLSIDRVSTYINVLKARNYSLTYVSLSRLAFKYPSDANLIAELSFPSTDESGDGVRTRLTFSTEDGSVNPHSRIQIPLQQFLNMAPNRDVDPQAFVTFVSLLSFTLPLLRAFDRMTSIDQSSVSVTVHPHSASSYKILYRSPLPRVQFLVQAREKNGKYSWHIQDVGATQQDRDPGLSAALSEIWRGQGRNWIGLKTGAVACLGEIEELLGKVDEVVRRFRGEPAAAPPLQQTGPEVVVLD